MKNRKKLHGPLNQLPSGEVKILALSPLKTKHTQVPHTQKHRPAQSNVSAFFTRNIAPNFIFKSLWNPEQLNLLENEPSCNLVEGFLPGTGAVKNEGSSRHQPVSYPPTWLLLWLELCTSQPQKCSLNWTSLTHLPSVSPDITHTRRKGWGRKA